MGVVRVLLALAVVFQHAYGTAFYGGLMAVQLFFIISGFVISFILIELRSYATVWAFYKNRILRLFPIYYVVALGSLVLYLGAPLLTGEPTPFIEVYQSVDAAGWIMLVVSNIVLFGQDVIMFTAVHDGVFHLHHDFLDSDILTWRGLLVPPAWSLSVELTFYLIAPFILTRPKLLIALFSLSIAVRLYLMNAGLMHIDPWNYRFFPSELALFILGAWAHQYGMPLARRLGLLTHKRSQIVTWAFIGLVLIFVTLDRDFPRLLMIVLFTLALPFMFHFQKHNRWDRWIGELSYPIYIVHWPIMVMVNVGWDRFASTTMYEGIDETLFICALCILAALILKKCVADPIEATRDKLRRPAKHAHA